MNGFKANGVELPLCRNDELLVGRGAIFTKVEVSEIGAEVVRRIVGACFGLEVLLISDVEPVEDEGRGIRLFLYFKISRLSLDTSSSSELSNKASSL